MSAPLSSSRLTCYQPAFQTCSKHDAPTISTHPLCRPSTRHEETSQGKKAIPTVSYMAAISFQSCHTASWGGSVLGMRLFLLQFVSEENTTMPLEVSYSPVSIGLLRMWLHFAEAMKTMRTLGQCRAPWPAPNRNTTYKIFLSFNRFFRQRIRRHQGNFSGHKLVATGTDHFCILLSCKSTL